MLGPMDDIRQGKGGFERQGLNPIYIHPIHDRRSISHSRSLTDTCISSSIVLNYTIYNPCLNYRATPVVIIADVKSTAALVHAAETAGKDPPPVTSPDPPYLYGLAVQCTSR